MKLTTTQKLYYTQRTIVSNGFGTGLKFAANLFLGKDVKIRPKGIKHSFLIRGNSSDPAVAFATFIKKEYKTPKMDEISVILDLGANVGYSAIFFSNHYPTAKIIALEPDPNNFSSLIQNTKLYPNIIPLNLGVWWRKAHLRVMNPNNDSWGFRFEESQNGGVDCVTVQNLIHDYGQGEKIMAKIDIEGAEKDIFLRDNSWIQHVSIIQMEIHGCWKAIFDNLIDQDYEAGISGENIILNFPRHKTHAHQS